MSLDIVHCALGPQYPVHQLAGGHHDLGWGHCCTVCNTVCWYTYTASHFLPSLMSPSLFPPPSLPSSLPPSLLEGEREGGKKEREGGVEEREKAINVLHT